MCLCTRVQEPFEARGLRSHGAAIVGVCELPEVGTGNPRQGLHKDVCAPNPLSHLLSAAYHFFKKRNLKQVAFSSNIYM